jgi:hypothetical protein
MLRSVLSVVALVVGASSSLASLTVTSQQYDRSLYTPFTGLVQNSISPIGAGTYGSSLTPASYNVTGLQFPNIPVTIKVTDAASNSATSSWTANSLHVRTQVAASRVLNTPNIVADWRDEDSRVLAAVNANITFSLATGSNVDLSYGRTSLATSGSVTPFNVGRTLQLQSLDGAVTYWSVLPPPVTGSQASTTVFLPAGDYRVNFGTGSPIGAEAFVDVQPGDLAMTVDFSMVVPSPGVLAVASAGGLVALRRRRAIR